MRIKNTRILLIIVCIVLGLQSYNILPHNFPQVNAVSGVTPQLIRQGPIQTTFAPSSFYWYQIGAMGDASSQNVDGASIAVRTVFDQVKNDAHSYWVGLSFQSGAFVQVGYLNGLSTTGQPYCCAWFFETFNTPSCDCPPTIGLEDSAGPIGSWHTYSMSYTGNGVWSFYMDGQLLGRSPTSGPNFLGTGTANSGSCTTCAPAGIAEVAQAVDNTDVIGPAEFTNLTMHKGGTWQPVGAATTYCCNGYSSNTALPISYGLAEIQGVDNDYLAGTHIRPSAKGTPLWHTTSGLSNTISFSFIDKTGNPFSPDWISMQDLGNPNSIIYYTKYQSQIVPLSSTGTYVLTYESWHGVNVSQSTSVSDSSSSQTIQGNVFSVPIRVVGRFYSLPVSGATLLTFLPDSTNQTSKTDSEGNVTLYQIPPGNYSLRVTPPFGVPSVSKTMLAGPINLSLSVFSITELLTIVVPPIAIAIGLVIMALRREQTRRAGMATAPAYPMTIPASYCRACGKPLGPTEYFCTTCGTPRSSIPQPPPAQQETSPPPPAQAPAPSPSSAPSPPPA
jgi:hypothetical protein